MSPKYFFQAIHALFIRDLRPLHPVCVDQLVLIPHPTRDGAGKDDSAGDPPTHAGQHFLQRNSAHATDFKDNRHECVYHSLHHHGSA